MTKSQKRITVTFPDNDAGIELYGWVKDKGKIVNDAAFIRQLLYEKMLEEKNIKK